MTLKDIFSAWTKKTAGMDDDLITAEEYDEFAKEHTSYYDLCCGRGWREEED